MNPMKLNTAIICLSPYSGGMEIDSIKLAKKLSIFSNITIIAKENYFIDNTKEEYLTNNIMLETIRFKYSFSPSIIFYVRKIMKRKNIQNVIFFGASELKSLYFSFLGLNINLIVRHGTTKTRPKKDLFHKLIYSKVNYHVSICKHLLKNVRYIIPFGIKTQEKLIYSSIQISSKLEQQNHDLILLHVGRIAKGKGQIDAIKACSILHKNNIDFKLYIVGGFNEDYKQEFNNIYNNLDYKENIILTGYTKKPELYYEKSTIFLFPSYGEGLSNAFLEALSYNLIPICYDNTSFSEFKELGFDFPMVENKNIQKLKITLLNTVNNINNYKQDNRELLKMHFSLEKEITDYLKILQ